MLTTRLICLLALLILGLAACRNDDVPLPTPMDINARATEIVLTQNAPPTGFSSVSFPQIDDNLRLLPGWRYTAILRFDGVVARTTRQVQTLTQAEVQFNQVASARRVVVTLRNDLQPQANTVNYEAVRLGPDAFLVRDGICLSNAGEDAAVAADLSAGSLLGGVRQANNLPREAVINNEQVWQYALNFDELNLPAIEFTDESQLLDMRGELWVSPKHNAVIRYHLNLDVENVLLLGSSLPVSGAVIMRYDVVEIGDVPNISIPFGC